MEFGNHWKVTEKSSDVQDSSQSVLNRILSRNSSVGFSSRIFYYRSPEGVPFQWEMRPGTPKDPPKEEILPPISPPPALLSLGLPKPCIVVEDTKPSLRSRLIVLWKEVKKNNRTAVSKLLMTKYRNQITKNVHSRMSNGDRLECSESDSSDGESTASPRYSSRSSLASWSFSNGNSRQASSRKSPPRNLMKANYDHITWKLSSVLVCVKRQV